MRSEPEKYDNDYRNLASYIDDLEEAEAHAIYLKALALE